MPRLYEKIRDQYLSKGDSPKVAKRKAAMTYNSLRQKYHNLPPLDSQHKSKSSLKQRARAYK